MSEPSEGELREPAGKPALTDQELELQNKLVALERDRTELDRQRANLATERANRKLRTYVAGAALAVMAIQILAANAVFVWYGDTNGWNVPASAISAWLGSTVVQIVAVVLVIMNYLFPKGGPPQ